MRPRAIVFAGGEPGRRGIAGGLAGLYFALQHEPGRIEARRRDSGNGARFDWHRGCRGSHSRFAAGPRLVLVFFSTPLKSKMPASESGRYAIKFKNLKSKRRTCATCFVSYALDGTGAGVGVGTAYSSLTGRTDFTMSSSSCELCACS